MMSSTGFPTIISIFGPLIRRRTCSWSHLWVGSCKSCWIVSSWNIWIVVGTRQNNNEVIIHWRLGGGSLETRSLEIYSLGINVKNYQTTIIYIFTTREQTYIPDTAFEYLTRYARRDIQTKCTERETSLLIRSPSTQPVERFMPLV